MKTATTTLSPLDSNRDNLVILDGKSIFYRGFYAMGNLSLADGTPTGGVFGFASILVEIIDKLKPEYLVVAWDKAKTNIRSRRAIYPLYKANRHPAPPAFYAQIPLLMELLDAFHVPLYELDDYEADDIIGTLSRDAAKKGLSVQIISGDLDMLQIVDQSISLYHTRRGFSDVTKFDIPALEAKYDLKKAQFLDLKSLKGDSSDNIPGVPGIGEKTAIKLLKQYQTLDQIFAHLNEIKGSLKQKLIDGKDLAYTSKKLASIQFDAPLHFTPEASRLADFDPARAYAVLEKFRFFSLIPKFTKLFPHLKPGNITGPMPEEKLGQDQPSIGAPAAAQSSQTKIDPVAINPVQDIPKTVPANTYLSYHVKDDLHAQPDLLETFQAGRPFWDLGQVDFLLDPLKPKSKQSSLFAEQNLHEICQAQLNALAKLPQLYQVATTLDFPLIPVLYQMEVQGIMIDQAYFKDLHQSFTREINALSQAIFTAVGSEFNLNSPLQLSHILFDVLKLPKKGIPKTSRAYSTGRKELQKLRPFCALIPQIERYREVQKLLGTYIDPLPALADQNNRIHTTFTQDVTATGRLSSINPNLQNIPVRSEDGKRIRRGFVAKDSYTFVSADYAQFELRLAAALADDQELIKDFNLGTDIHTKTAAKVFNLPLEKVTPDKRRVAKTVNFGVLYGMSPKGLADATGLSMHEAKTFIDAYFKLRAPIRKYLDNTLSFGRQHGYVATLFGRRRPTPDLNSPRFQTRAAAERAAANMPIQGTEADLMKKAMLTVAQSLARLHPDAKLILQVHDSLIIECKKTSAPAVGALLKKSMENIAPFLPVKLDVDLKTGTDWSQL